MARRTKAEAQATRDALLDAAEQLFDSQGVARTSLAHIAAAAGTTRGAIYWHFTDKAALFAAMMDRATLALSSTDTVPPNKAVTLDAVCQGLLTALERIATHERLRRVMRIAIHRVEYVGELGSVQSRHLSSHRDWIARSERALKRAYAAQQITPALPASQAALGLQVLIEGLLQSWLLDPGAYDLVAMGERLIATWLRGVGLAPATAAR